MKTREEQAVFTQSLQWLERVQQVIPSGCSTLAKTPERLFPGETAICCVEARQSKFIDIDGNEWLDCEMAMGTAAWGHAREEVQAAIVKQLAKGTSFSVPADVELAAAELVLARFEQRYAALRFCKGGADAVSGAVRLARAYTRRPKVMSTAYHGWSDWSAYGYYGGDAEAMGIPAEIRSSTVWVPHASLRRIEDEVRRHGDQLACIVLCPNEWQREELGRVMELAARHSILIVFDEVTSGARMGKQATAGEYGLWPDILCLSKGLANGLPLGVVLGSEPIMRLCGQVKFSSAHSSETIALAALIACEKLMQAAPSWPSWRGGTERLMAELQTQLEALGLTEELALHGTYASFCLRSRAEQDFYRDPFRAYMMKRLAQQGIFTKGFFVFSDAHSEAELLLIQESLKEALLAWSKQEHRKSKSAV
ncbi:aminotransferase class III-fold pyridoxal phosphate-dependent enzyme [Paenibacillus sp. KS-LC4]|uniref:aminotransferase class III-fold pyridoxal phosphate-dependent enzyme n=1 Tax=Paenibacillus sp. KS-LC4 TaxID=2979727 RepID=UPI0030CDEA14